MTAPAVPGRRSRPLIGWPLAVVGWLVAASAPAIFWVTGVPAAVVGFASAAIVAVGCLAIGLRAGGKIMFILLPTFFIGGFGLAIGADALTDDVVLHLVGKTVTCHVTAVRKTVNDVVTTGGDGRSKSTEDIGFDHTTVCPNATYTIDRLPPYPVGTKAQVTYDTRGRIAPRFTDRLSGIRRTGLISSAAGGLIVFVAPFAAWAVGRRRKNPTGTAPRTPHSVDGPPPRGQRVDPERSQRAAEAVNDFHTGRKVSGARKMMRLAAEQRRAEEARARDEWQPPSP